MHKKHIFVGGRNDIFTVQESAQRKDSVYWAVPESSEVGDQGFFLLPEEIGFYALGEVISEKVWDGNKFTGWRADIRILHLLKPNMLLKTVQQKFPDWIDVQHPRVWNRSFTINTAFYSDFYNHIRYGQDDRGSALNQIIR